ncbi:NAD(P)/FAD-dependent oxidoreductase [Falsirhodobacter halotolerans]|uniref:NAD(P)/FAD-dependent oxidoreductase n=1 Tax=Falsirhodobacter halotolerans TaxID=1146892 RepID=UPI001FD1E1CC|nr:NAD(P)/FAD-dependent oxidoreductase [Falsirhodobacter halotolerans]MCJ8139613.1 NAD(P)/FAD-dependent oxidoreductase [Falsirhodobacter halotolerans]
MKKVDVAILGAGAAGMFCAIEAARRGRRVLVIDHAKAAGEKIRISGGGRCNFTNTGVAVDRFLSRNPRFALSALKRFTAWDFIARVDEAGIAWHEKSLGQLFCDGPSTQIVDMLLRQMNDAGVELWLNTSIESVGQGYRIATARGVVEADSVVVATGGKSIPKMGATGFGYQIAAQFGLSVTETRPALVPMTFAEQELSSIKPLSGLAVDAVATTGARFEEPVLFTHRGLSGPAILQASSYWREGETLTLDLAPARDITAHLRALRQTEPRIALRTALNRIMPEKLARFLESRCGEVPAIGALSNGAIDRIESVIHALVLKPVGTEGYRTAEVTLGGVDTDALDARTMQAKNVEGLYFIGEVVDVTGWLGGYNFQWAWSSGWAAGQYC